MTIADHHNAAAEATPTDVALLERVVARDAGAVGQLYDRHSRLLFGLILRIVADHGEAEEVLQEVFVQLWTHAGTYKMGLGSPVGWLVGIARNRAIDRLRANSVRRHVPNGVSTSFLTESPEASAAVNEQQREVHRALEALPGGQRELIEQAYFVGLTHSELATRFRLPLGTVKTRIRTGLLALKRQLQGTHRNE